MLGFFRRGRSLDELMTLLARGATPELEGEFFKRLLTGSLSLASPCLEHQGLEPGVHVAGDAQTIRFLGTTDPQGRQAALAFTDAEAVLRWRPAGCDTARMKVTDLCRLVLSTGVETVLVNRGSPNCCLLAKETLQDLAEGRAPLPTGTRRPQDLAPGSFALSKPPQLPPQFLCDALAAEAALHKPIAGVYLAALAIGSDPPRPVVVLELDAGADPQSVVPPFASGASARLDGRVIPDVLPVPGDDALLRAARENGVRVYSRKPGC